MNLKTIVTMKKYAGKTVEECINEHYYAFNILINNHPEWYDKEVLDYLKDASFLNASNHKNSKLLDKDYKKVLQRENT